MTLEERVQVQEDIQAITQLKGEYCVAADAGWNHPAPDGDVVATLFAPDGVWDGGSFGKAEGREAIRALFASLKSVTFAFHRITNPIIKVSGDTATGQWHLLSPGVMGGQSVVIGAMYNDEFIRTSEGWKFKKLTLSVACTSNS